MFNKSSSEHFFSAYLLIFSLYTLNVNVKIAINSLKDTCIGTFFEIYSTMIISPLYAQNVDLIEAIEKYHKMIDVSKFNNSKKKP